MQSGRELLNEAEYQRQVAEAVAQRLANTTSAAEALAQLLGISKAVAYKRLGSQTYFTARELAVLQAELDVVVSPHRDDPRPLMAFRAPSATQDGRYDLEAYMDSLRRAQERLHAAQLQSGLVTARVSTSDLPVFYFFLEPELCAFKLYSFAVEGTRRPDAPLKLSEFMEAQRTCITRTQQYAQTYATIAATEIWSRTPIDNFLRQVQHFVQVGLLPTREDAEAIFNALRRVLNRLQRWIELGEKKGGASFTLLCNENHYTNSLILVSHPSASALYVTFDNPNFLVSEQREAAEFFERHFAHLQTISDQVSRIGQLSASRYIGDQLQRLERMRQRVGLTFDAKLLELD